ncbi:hypothetical protein [Kribbella sp. NPDC050459]|uniref:YqeB family protein n=1 Tax=Kribbella sp. NPDC050459 TaxID=3155785 RepID=UPI0033EFE39B
MAQLVHARKPVPPRTRVEFGGSVALGAFAVLAFADGVWQVAAALAVLAVALLPVAFVIAGRAVRRHPDRIDVRSDGITALRLSGASWELIRNDDSVLRIVQSQGRPYLQLDGMTSSGRIPLARFDVDEIQEATHTEGWPWSPAPAGRAAGLASGGGGGAAVRRETRVLLRDGGRGPLPWAGSRVAPKVAMGWAVVGAAGVMVLAFEGGSPAAIVAVVLGPSILLALGLVGLSVRHALRVRLAVTVGPDRVTVAHGTLASQVVQRTAVTSSSIGRRYVRLRGPDGKTLLYVPLNPQRTAVLNALSANGWPI